MSNYSPSFMAFSEAVLKSNKDLINEWARDNSNQELSESCKMLMDAAGQGNAERGRGRYHSVKGFLESPGKNDAHNMLRSKPHFRSGYIDRILRKELGIPQKEGE
jgi:hypothetical protein